MKVLITSGATQEPIDQVRFITNFSTGSTGALIADHFRSKGHQVVYLRGIGASSPPSSPEIEEIEYTDFSDLDSKIRTVLRSGQIHAVIHAAAVSDYSVASVEFDGQPRVPRVLQKIESRAGDVVLRLKRNFKILARLKSYSPEKLRVVGFKLTNTSNAAERRLAIQAVAKPSEVDYVVHNDYSDIREKRRQFTLFKVTEEGPVELVDADSQLRLAQVLAEELDHF
ncbi:MAG: hypothetical protein A2X94_07255 [Bdellovibrionales bacterium GWB1_55_8]|nr:MAG: hypothetical protein A2X94_07255 [Bdellovibrionales bacterium GWB1_55_8]